jgi:hypothetical protein
VTDDQVVNSSLKVINHGSVKDAFERVRRLHVHEASEKDAISLKRLNLFVYVVDLAGKSFDDVTWVSAVHEALGNLSFHKHFDDFFTYCATRASHKNVLVRKGI